VALPETGTMANASEGPANRLDEARADAVGWLRC
jgi:hypothetical protein